MPPPPDKCLASLIGVGPEAAKDFGTTRVPPGVEPYDETITSERIMAVGDMYYLWQHEKIGVFRVVQKLQELFKAGTVRLSAGPGAFALYQFECGQAQQIAGVVDTQGRALLGELVIFAQERRQLERLEVMGEQKLRRIIHDAVSGEAPASRSR